eukprot:scaffold4335_cov119-Cylindrotheca_fusiformis.AAC.2
MAEMVSRTCFDEVGVCSVYLTTVHRLTYADQECVSRYINEIENSRVEEPTQQEDKRTICPRKPNFSNCSVLAIHTSCVCSKPIDATGTVKENRHEEFMTEGLPRDNQKTTP